MCPAYPLRRMGLDLYETEIVDMATRYQGKGFYEHHKMFSAQAAAHLSYSHIKVNWSVRNRTFFCNIFTKCKVYSCYHCNSPLHMAALCLKLIEKGYNSTHRNNTSIIIADIQGRKRVLVDGKELCNNNNPLGRMQSLPL